MELRQAEAVGLLDDHDRRVRDVDADLDHGRRDEHVELAGFELSHQLAPLGRPEPSVEQADAVPLQLALLQAFGLTLGGPRDARLGLLDQRADHVRLATVVEVLPQPLVRVARAVLRHPGRLHGLAVRGRLRDLAHREVSVDGEREGAGNRRRGHVQDVWGAVSRDRATLLHPETVLLVDHGDGHFAQIDALLDERVRPDEDLRRRRVVLHRARQQRDPDAELSARILEREEVLLGEGLGRRHQRALLARLDRPEKRVERNDGLARADFALKQPLHRRRLGEIGVDLGDRALLVRRELEGKQLPVAGDELAGVAERRRLLLLATAATPREPDLEHEQLVEGQPPSPALRLLGGPGSVDRRQRIGAQRHRVHEVGRRCVGAVTNVGKRLPDELAELLRRDLLARGVHGGEVGRGGSAVQVVGADVELVPPELAAEAHPRAGPELVDEPCLVEPDGGDLPAVVRDPRLDDREPRPGSPNRGADDLAGDGDLLLAREQVGDPHFVDGGLVAERPVLEQVCDRVQAELCELLGDGRPHSGQRLDSPGKPLGPWKRPRARPARRARYLGECSRKVSRQSATEYRTGGR